MEKIIGINIDDNYDTIIKSISSRHKVKYISMKDIDGMETVENIVSQSIIVSDGTHPLPKGSLLLFCDIEDIKLDKILAALRKNQVMVTYKAILTPTNKKWNVLRLFVEMEREKKSY